MTAARKNSKRETKTIALLTYGANDPNNHPLWEGVHAEAQAQGANLICFPGKSLNSKAGDLTIRLMYSMIWLEKKTLMG